MKANHEPLIHLNPEIVDNIQVGKDLFHMELLAPEIAQLAQPGQFIEILTGDSQSVDPLLRRPISIYSIDKFSGKIGFIYRTIGRGTNWIAKRCKGELIDVFGPIGNGYNLPSTAKRVLLVGGGIGMPPLFSLAQAHPEREFVLYYGAQNSDDIILLEAWQRLGIPYRIATDDGSLGSAGRVTDLLKIDGGSEFDLCCACGPKPMLKALNAYLEEINLDGLFSLEERMACGVGACLGCVCKTRDGYRRVCVDGPVFSTEELVWE